MEKFIENAKGKIDEISDGIKSLFEKEVVETIKEYGIEKINDALETINSSTDIISKTGYSITDISISIALPPVLHISFNRIEDISDTEEANLLEENKANNILYPVLVALFKANALQKSIKTETYVFSGLAISIGLAIPSIDLKFKKK